MTDSDEDYEPLSARHYAAVAVGIVSVMGVSLTAAHVAMGGGLPNPDAMNPGNSPEGAVQQAYLAEGVVAVETEQIEPAAVPDNERSHKLGEVNVSQYQDHAWVNTTADVNGEQQQAIFLVVKVNGTWTLQ